MDDQLIYWILGAVAVYWLFIKVHKDEDGRIEDQSVTVDRVIEILEGFKAKSDSPETITEAQVQKQLFDYMNKHFVHVMREQGIENVNALKIDMDIGRGKVGIEVKLARALFKSSSLQRLVGQMDDYTENKYDDKNLIVAVFGTTDEAKERGYLKNIQEKIEAVEAKYLFLKIQSPKQKEPARP
jgi:hypothetical protein